ncbi:hypothetical protein SLEP1_g53488 [Rubroshorea leprosula]|uniref:Uncharacterized protein n=1 Tax=Rubroshorea leprosula TaxID=152421 RepID=A0AAV5M9H9_9ROSI|nr:hypothetical protein SLEP1_g53488 [Rubroshorea leprosula]
MEFFREVGELRGNQGMEEEEGVMSVEPIAMIVPPELQDLPKTLTPENSASSSAHEGFDANHSSPSKGSSSEKTPSAGKDVGEGEVIPCWKLWRWSLGHTYMNYPTLTPDDLEFKDRITNYVKAVGLIDLEALVTLEVLTVRGFVDVANLFSEGDMSSMLKRQRERAQRSRARGAWSSTQWQTRFDERSPTAPRSSSQRERGSSSASWPHAERRVEAVSIETWRCARKDSNVEDDVPLIWRRLNSGSQSGAVRSPDTPVAQAHNTAEALPTPAASMGPRITYPEGFSYTKVDCQLTMVQGSSQDCCKWLTSDKASLEDEVNRLQSSEMANKAASAESRADELANKVNQLKEELEKVQVKKESGIQAALDEVVRAVDRSQKAEAERDSTLNELNTLRQQVAVADQDLTQDAVAVASMNTTIEIYNDVRGKVLKHRPNFPIGKLAFFEGEEFDEEGKSLASPADTTVRHRWEMNKDGVPIRPPSILEEGEDFENLPRFDSWAGDAPAE